MSRPPRPTTSETTLSVGRVVTVYRRVASDSPPFAEGRARLYRALSGARGYFVCRFIGERNFCVRQAVPKERTGTNDELARINANFRLTQLLDQPRFPGTKPGRRRPHCND